MEILQDLVSDYTLRTVALGSAVLGLVAGVLGPYAVLRKQSLLGDAVAHAALPGIAIAFLLTGSKASLVLMVGAATAGWLGTLLVLTVIRTTRVKEDSALGLMLSVFFGLGLVLLTFIQRRPGATKAGLDSFLFGQAAALVTGDVITMGVLGAAAIALVLGLWKEFKLVGFDPDFGASLGLPVRALDMGMTWLIVVAIVLGLQTVGVVLMSAMLIAPAAAARQWTDRMGVMVFLSALFGAVGGVSGAVISSSVERLPTGPTIVLAVTVIALGSLVFAPNRGLAWNAVRMWVNRRRLIGDTVLADLYRLASSHDDLEYGHSQAVLQVMGRGTKATGTLVELARKGLVRRGEGDQWSLTREGIERARRVLDQAGGREE